MAWFVKIGIEWYSFIIAALWDSTSVNWNDTGAVWDGISAGPWYTRLPTPFNTLLSNNPFTKTPIDWQTKN